MTKNHLITKMQREFRSNMRELNDTRCKRRNTSPREKKEKEDKSMWLLI